MTVQASAGRRESGQAVVLAIGGSFALIAGALALVAIAGAVTGKGRAQRAADLAAISAARSMRDDLPRLLSPPTLPNGLPNPEHIGKLTYLLRARVAATAAGVANGVGVTRLRVGFPDALSFAPVRVRTSVLADLAGTTRPDRGDGGSRSRRRGRRPALAAVDRLRRRLQRPAHLSPGGGDEAGRRRRLRPDGRRSRGRGRGPDGQLGLPLGRRTGGALRRQPGPAMGRTSGPLAPPLRDRARPRPRLGLRLARRQRRPLRLRPALFMGGLALRLRQAARAVLGGRELGRGPGGRRRPSPGSAACRASSPLASGTRWCARPLAGTSPRRCSPRS